METLAVILPAIATGSVVLLTGFSLYFKIRHNFPTTVNCWFCNENSEVPYGNRDCWDCPHCDQYNGFLPDGSYNKIIPAQHDELLNHSVHALSNKLLDKKLSPSDINGNGLCRKCNTNQELKIQQLAGFTPVIPAHYDEEVDKFRSHLERAYRLCSQCEGVLKKTLHKEKCDLLSIRLRHSRNSPVQSRNILSAFKMSMSKFLPTKLQMALYLTTLLSVGLGMATSYHLNKEEIPLPEAVWNSTVWTYIPSLTGIAPPLVDLFPVLLHYEIVVAAACAVVYFIASLKRKYKIDYLCVSLWMLLHIQCWIRKSGYLEKYISLLDFNMIHVAVTILTLFASICSVLTSGQTSKTKHEPSCLISSSESSLDISHNLEDTLTASLEDCHQIKDSSLCKPEPIQKKDERTSILNSTVSKYWPANTTQMESNTSPVFPVQVNSSEDIDCGLGKLSLGTERCDKWMNRRNVNPSTFETKLNGQNSYYDFNRTSHFGLRNRPLIRPSQLNLNKNITQSSWVAGGYWQSPTHNRFLSPKCGVGEVSNTINFATLSRSSSQSSGFVSQSSQAGLYDGVATSLPNSHAGSFGGDFDRFSALSEPIYPYASPSVYFASTRTVPYFYPGPIILPQTYDMIPPGYVANYAFPQSRPVIAQTSCFYPPQPARELSAIWNPSVFTSTPMKKPRSHVPTPPDVLSQSDSEKSKNTESAMSIEGTKLRPISSPRQRTLFSVIKENMFMATLFCCSLFFNAFFLFLCFMLGNSNFAIPKIF